MKLIISLAVVSALLTGCGQKAGSEKAQTMPAPKASEKVATFAGGCFWAMQKCMSELKGVNKAVSGYAGGSTPNPTYEQVTAETTGHAESVQVYYDPEIISFKQLTEAFFYAHDPTQVNRQGPDIGTDYRSIAFYRTPEEREILEGVINNINGSRHYTEPVVTEVKPLKVIYRAENYHQNYYDLNPDNGYIVNVSRPKVLKMRQMVPGLIRKE